MAAAVGGRRGLLGVACDEAVAPLGVVPDAPFADELSQDGADGLVPGSGAFADLALGERRLRFGERLEDAPFGVSGRSAASNVSTWRRRNAGPLPSSASSISISLRPGAARCSTVMTTCLFRRRRYRFESPPACSSELPRSAWPGRVAPLFRA